MKLKVDCFVDWLRKAWKRWWNRQQLSEKKNAELSAELAREKLVPSIIIIIIIQEPAKHLSHSLIVAHREIISKNIYFGSSHPVKSEEKKKKREWDFGMLIDGLSESAIRLDLFHQRAQTRQNGTRNQQNNARRRYMFFLCLVWCAMLGEWKVNPISLLLLAGNISTYIIDNWFDSDMIWSFFVGQLALSSWTF